MHGGLPFRSSTEPLHTERQTVPGRLALHGVTVVGPGQAGGKERQLEREREREGGTGKSGDSIAHERQGDW